MLTRMYLYSTSTKLSIDVWLYLDRPGSLSDDGLLCYVLLIDRPLTSSEQTTEDNRPKYALCSLEVEGIYKD